jgi:hypothetical protein
MDFFAPEDTGFCQIIREKGFEVLIDPAVIVGHEKRTVLK